MEEDNQRLCMEPTRAEIKDALSSIPKSSPRLDGFSFEFYLTCWDFIKEDVIEATEDFFCSSPRARFYGASFIILILKVPNPLSFDKFCPTSLCYVA